MPTNLRVCIPTYLRFSGALCYRGYLARSILLLHGIVTGHQDPAWLAHFKAQGGERNELYLNLIMNMNRIVRSGINSSTPILLLDIPARRARHDMGLIAPPANNTPTDRRVCHSSNPPSAPSLPHPCIFDHLGGTLLIRFAPFKRALVVHARQDAI